MVLTLSGNVALWAVSAAAGLASVAAIVALTIANRERQRARLCKRALRRSIRDSNRRDRARTHFLAAASHDLRQPLQAAGMFGEVLAVRLEGTPHAPVVDKLIKSIEATSSLLSAVLEVSSLDMGKIEPAMSTVQLDGLLSRLFQQMEHRAQAKSLRYIYVPTKATVVTDPVLLERLVRNLLVNALAYTDRGGVVLGCRHRMKSLSGQQQIGIQIADTGPGIPHDRLSDIFEDFFRINPKHAGGTLGLGLSVVRRVAVLLGLGVTVQSQENRGSTFTVWMDLPTGAVAG
jgi:signal transduction histidine kinase